MLRKCNLMVRLCTLLPVVLLKEKVKENGNFMCTVLANKSFKNIDINCIKILKEILSIAKQVLELRFFHSNCTVGIVFTTPWVSTQR